MVCFVCVLVLRVVSPACVCAVCALLCDVVYVAAVSGCLCVCLSLFVRVV